MPDNPTMHCQSEIEADIGYYGLLPDETLLRWFQDSYSTSKHLLTLYSIVRGLSAKTIAEVGFGRSSFVLARAAYENSGSLFTCDTRDFSYLFNQDELSVTHFINGKSDKLWDRVKEIGIDFAFLDYFSSEELSDKFIFNQFYHCFNLLKENGMICIHDTIVQKYSVSKFFEDLKTRRFGLLHNKDLELVSLPFNYGLGIVRRLKPSPYGKLEDTYPKKEEDE